MRGARRRSCQGPWGAQFDLVGACSGQGVNVPVNGDPVVWVTMASRSADTIAIVGRIVDPPAPVALGARPAMPASPAGDRSRSAWCWLFHGCYVTPIHVSG